MAGEPKAYYLQGTTPPRTPRAGQQPPPWDRTAVIGKPHPRVDGYERVSGTAIYPSDVRLERMLHGAILRCPHPAAEVTSINAKPAEQLAGVRVVFTPSSPGVAGVKWPWSDRIAEPLLTTTCRFEGEAVAAVAADTPQLARDALRAIEVSYRVKPHVVDEQRALEQDAPPVHEGGNRVKTETHRRGDPDRGFAAADAVVQASFRTACQLHTPMELHGCVASWDGDRLTLWESTQGVYAVQEQVARVLRMPLSRVRVIGHYMGGGFGSKLRASKYSVLAALLAKRAGRPVKLFLSREETYLTMGNRPPTRMRLKAGVKKDGTLTALELEAVGASGAYPAGGTALLDWLVRDLYACPNVSTKTTDVLVNAGPARPFRAPGHPQCAFALEQVLDMLAHKIGMDPVELRLKNIPERSQGREGAPPFTTTGLEQCIRRGAETFGWNEARRRTASARSGAGPLKRGVGMASCLWFAGGGGPPSTVLVKVLSDGSVNLNMGASDIGTGTKTVMAMVVAEELGVTPDSVQIEHADTQTTQYATPSGGSKTVPTEAPAVRAAAVAVKRELLGRAARQLKVPRADLRFKGRTIETADGKRKVTVAELARRDRGGVVVGVGYRGPNPKGATVSPFAAQFCEVEVNTGTGEVRLLRMVGADESGRVLDRLTFDNQILGGITMGIGFGMTEFRALDRRQTGKLLNRNWHDYKLPTALDVPLETTPLAIELPDPRANNTGAKGLGEPVTIPTAAAIANAIHDACGIRVTETPFNPVLLGRLLAGKSQTEEG